MKRNMMLFIFNDVLPAGGLWTVRAWHDLEAARLAHDFCPHASVEEYQAAIAKGRSFIVHTFPEDLPEVVQVFWGN